MWITYKGRKGRKKRRFMKCKKWMGMMYKVTLDGLLIMLMRMLMLIVILLFESLFFWQKRGGRGRRENQSRV